MALEGTFYRLQELGLFDVILPFILVFTIVFAVLQKAHIFSKKKADGSGYESSKNFNSSIALVMALAVVFPHVLGYYPPDQDIVLIINHALPNVSIVLVAVVMALLIIGVFGGQMKLLDNSMSGMIAMAAFGVIIYIFGSAANWWSLPGFLYMLDNPDTMGLVVFILVFAIIIWFITKEDKTFADAAAREEWEAKHRLSRQLAKMIKP
jgi:hypothetical protein